MPQPAGHSRQVVAKNSHSPGRMFSGGMTLGISLLTSFRGGLVASAMLLPPVSHKKVRLDISGISSSSGVKVPRRKAVLTACCMAAKADLPEHSF